MVEMLLKSFFDGLTGNKVRRSKRPREVSYGDVVCVEGGLLKRYGIWTGENFILYGEDSRGKNIVHEETFRGFLGGAETVHRARSKLGQGGYLTSEHFAMWCKTGIAESHELASVRDFWDRMIVY